jgi:hypothetical protein
MQSWQRSRSGPRRQTAGRTVTLRLPAPVARYLETSLQRLGVRITAGVPVTISSPPESPGLTRARAALADARQQMPGLLGIVPEPSLESTPYPSPRPSPNPGRGGPEEVEIVVESVGARCLAPATPESDTHAGEPPALPEHDRAARSDIQETPSDARLARVEELVLHLEEERQQLGAEVAALRLIAEELRDTLVRLDERASWPPPATPEPQQASPPSAPAPLLPPEPVFPAGSVGVDVHLSAVPDAEAVERLRLLILEQPEVDLARVLCIDKDAATLRLYLRFPLGRRAFIDLLARAAPSAKPLLGPAPASMLLRLRPS